jgi:transposase
MGIFDKLKENLDKQEEMHMKHNAAMEKMKLHEQVHEQAELERRQAKLEKIQESATSGLTAEEKQLLKRREERIEKLKQEKKEKIDRYKKKLSEAGSNLYSSGQSIYKMFSGNGKSYHRHKRKRR